jgi:hypothetical protein
MNYTLDSAASAWVPVGPVPPAAVHDARLQLHHAAQVANSPAISYLQPVPDDSHTNFGWSADLRAFVSQQIPFEQPLRFAVRPDDLTLLAVDEAGAATSSFALSGHTLDEAHAWTRAQCESAGGDGTRYTSRKHYEIPAHAVASGAKFTADPAATGALSQLWDNATRFLDAATAGQTRASDVRLWPHHFDAGFIITIDAKRSIGGGFTPGDQYYDEPYWYISPSPRPDTTERPSLGGGAHWHEKDFLSAVLPWTAYAMSKSQGAAVAAYLHTALPAARSLLGA